MPKIYGMPIDIQDFQFRKEAESAARKYRKHGLRASIFPRKEIWRVGVFEKNDD